MERHSNKVNERVKSVRDATADGIYVKYIYGNCNFAFSLDQIARHQQPDARKLLPVSIINCCSFSSFFFIIFYVKKNYFNWLIHQLISLAVKLKKKEKKWKPCL